MEALNLKPSAKDVEADAQLKNQLTHEGTRAGIPEPRRMDIMNSRHAGTLSLVCEWLFFIHVIDESCGDPAIKLSFVDLYEVQKQGKKMIGCREGVIDAVLLAVSSIISSYLPPSRASCAGLSFLSWGRSFHVGMLQHVCIRLV
jgi:hypothetical protein